MICWEPSGVLILKSGGKGLLCPPSGCPAGASPHCTSGFSHILSCLRALTCSKYECCCMDGVKQIFCFLCSEGPLAVDHKNTVLDSSRKSTIPTTKSTPMFVSVVRGYIRKREEGLLCLENGTLRKWKLLRMVVDRLDPMQKVITQ